MSRRGCHLQVEMSPFPSCQDNWSCSRVKLFHHWAPGCRWHVTELQQTLQGHTEAVRNNPFFFFFLMPLRAGRSFQVEACVAHLLPQHNLIYLDRHRSFPYFTGRKKDLRGEKIKSMSKGCPHLGVEPCGHTQAQAVGADVW